MDQTIAIKEELFSFLLETYPHPGWSKNPEIFAEFIFMVDLATQIASDQEGKTELGSFVLGDELAALLVRESLADITPYSDFRELREKCLPSKREAMKKLITIINRSKADSVFNEITEQAGVLPSEETMLSEVIIDALARKVIDRLRPFIRFY